ncbi:MAG: TolC family protein [Gemmatimonadetes bacterium]|nr:TolC family protein [Gemmatimonadota bacterium]
MADRRGAALLLLALMGCAHYTPRPLDAPNAAAWEAARLDAPAVLAALDSVGAAPGAGRWRGIDVARAAWLRSPARRRADAEVEAARAALRTAGARPAPGIATESEFAFSGRDGSSRWGLALTGLFRVELGGKRGARQARAEAAVLSAVARGRAEGWELEGSVRREARALAALEGAAAAAQVLRGALDSVRDLAEARYADGALGTIELARLRADRATAGQEEARLARRRGEQRAVLAAEAGVPEEALRALGPLLTDASRCPDDAARPALLAGALERRWDLRVALAAYQEAEADLRGQVARSWPDLDLGPGLFFDHGVGKWTLALGLPDLLLHGNRGPIGEALAARDVAAARVEEVSAGVLTEVDAALGACRAVARERAAFDPAAAAARLAAMEAAWRRGEIGRLEVALARADLARLEQQAVELEGAEAGAADELAWRAGADALPER